MPQLSGLPQLLPHTVRHKKVASPASMSGKLKTGAAGAQPVPLTQGPG